MVWTIPLHGTRRYPDPGHGPQPMMHPSRPAISMVCTIWGSADHLSEERLTPVWSQAQMVEAEPARPGRDQPAHVRNHVIGRGRRQDRDVGVHRNPSSGG